MDAFFELRREFDSRISVSEKYNDFCEPHFHSNIELTYVTEGKIDVNINGQIRTLTKGCISIANSYDIHAYTNAENSKNIVVIIPIELVNDYIAMFHSKVLSTSFIGECGQTQQIFYILQKHLASQGPGYELISKGCAYSILGLILNCIELIEKPSHDSIDLARKILVYMQQNYLEPLSIESLAKHFGYHKDHLSRFFNSFLGCGFNNYLNALRSRHAAMLILDEQINLTDIAFTSGFENYRTFNRAFKHAYALTPSEYRKNIAASAPLSSE